MIRSTLIVAALAGISASASAQFALIDQIGPNSTFQEGQPGRASQEFEAANAAFHVAMIDDFRVNHAAGVTLRVAEAAVVGFNIPGGMSNNLHLVTGWRFEVYSSVAAAGANLTGDVASTTIAAGAAGITTPWTTAPQSGLVTLDISGANIHLNPGLYWMAIIPQLAFGTGGQLGVYDSTFVGFPANGNSHQVNPGGGFGFGQSAPRDTNSAYRLTAIPAPGAIALMGLAGLAAVRRRR